MAPSKSSAYRAPQKETRPRLVLRPMLKWRIVVFLVVLGLAPVALYLTLWSKTVGVTCTSAGDNRAACTVVEETVFPRSGGVSMRDHDDVARWKCVPASQDSDEDLGPDCMRTNAARAAESIVASPSFRADVDTSLVLWRGLLRISSQPPGGAIAVTFGSKTRALFVPILCVLGALAAFLLLARQRVVCTVDRAQRVLYLEARMRGERRDFVIPLRELVEFRVGEGARSPWLVARTKTGDTKLFRVRDRARAHEIVAELAWFLRD